jgi:hypothetical protein
MYISLFEGASAQGEGSRKIDIDQAQHACMPSMMGYMIHDTYVYVYVYVQGKGVWYWYPKASKDLNDAPAAA